MGVFDFVDDVVDRASKVAETVKTAADWVAEAAEKFGLGKIADTAKVVGKVARKFAIAPTPILQGGQKLIEHMIDQTGEGDPEWGQSFRTAGWKFKSLDDVLLKAFPGQEWQGGTASKAYAEKTESQRGQVVTLGDTDIDMGAIITAEAEQINRLRRLLEGQHEFLADFGKHTQYLGAGGWPGKALQTFLETTAVSAAMADCLPAMWQMTSDAKDNAKAVRKLSETYQQVASKVNISDSAGDFDPPRRQSTRRPPSPDGPGRPVTPEPPPGGAVPGEPAGPRSPAPVPAPGVPAPAPPAPGIPASAAPSAGAPGPAPSTTTPASAGPAGPRQFAVRDGTPKTPSSQDAPPQRSASTDGADAGAGERAPVDLVDEVREAPNPSATKT
ncbi:EspA/EspE family type VII secretion system effector [Mycolicibacterium thermoresistibile]